MPRRLARAHGGTVEVRAACGPSHCRRMFALSWCSANSTLTVNTACSTAETTLSFHQDLAVRGEVAELSVK